MRRRVHRQAKHFPSVQTTNAPSNEDVPIPSFAQDHAGKAVPIAGFPQAGTARERPEDWGQTSASGPVAE